MGINRVIGVHLSADVDVLTNGLDALKNHLVINAHLYMYTVSNSGVHEY